MFVRLQTADHRRLASPVQEEQGAMAAVDRTRIMRFTVFEKEYPVALVFAHRWCGIFSAPLRGRRIQDRPEQGLKPSNNPLQHKGSFLAARITCGAIFLEYIPQDMCRHQRHMIRYTLAQPVIAEESCSYN
jgi:hypothetical protein